MKKDWIIVIVVFYISCEIMCCLCNAKKCLRMFKSVSILIFDQNFMNGRYFQHPRGILDAIISVTEGLNSLGTLYIARFHKYAPLLRDPKMIPSCSRWNVHRKNILSKFYLWCVMYTSIFKFLKSSFLNSARVPRCTGCNCTVPLRFTYISY